MTKTIGLRTTVHTFKLSQGEAYKTALRAAEHKGRVTVIFIDNGYGFILQKN